MSLDVYLYLEEPIEKKGSGIFVKDNGATKELTIEEAIEKIPNFIIHENMGEYEDVFTSNITHNLGEMAEKAGIYYACWRPEEIGAKYAKDIIPLLEKGYKDLKSRPEYFKQFDSENGWGMYIHFLPWVKEYLNACRKYPNATIGVSR